MKRITVEKLNIYYKYGGDMDGFARVGKEVEKQNISSGDWELIDDLTQSLILIRNGYASDSFTSGTFKRLEELSDEQAYKQLIDNPVK